MNSSGFNFRRFERQPQKYQLYTTFNPSIEIIFETLETSDIDINPSNLMIYPIINRDFWNTFHHQNEQNQRQQSNKNAI